MGKTNSMGESWTFTSCFANIKGSPTGEGSEIAVIWKEDVALKCACPCFCIKIWSAGMLDPGMSLQYRKCILLRKEIWPRTRSSLGVGLSSGVFNKQLSTKSSASRGKRPSGVNFGAGSLTICCRSSKILIVIPPPCRLTPLLLRLSFLLVSPFLSFFSRLRAGGKGIPDIEPGRWGESVPSKSSKSDKSESDVSSSENGKRPNASSISEIPRDQTSDLTVYCAPWIRSG